MNMIRMGPPSPAFVWPIEVIERPLLGYTMDYIRGYIKLGELGHTKYISRVDVRTRLRICYRLVEAFEKLHQKTGYAYCDLSGNNILCDIKSGDVKIIDNDNLWVEGVIGPSTVWGTYRCMAPEIEAGTASHPNVETDLHSLAVLLFMTLLFHHPLLGDKVHDDSLLEKDALGKGAVYIYHPTDSRNRYTKYSEYGGIPISVLPTSLQRLFQDCFVNGLHRPQLRVRETNWKKELINQLDTLIRCPNRKCIGRQTFLSQPPRTNATCIWCGTKIYNIKLMRVSNPAGHVLRHKVLYNDDWLAAHHCKLDKTFNFDPQDVCARVEDDASHGLTLRNVSKETFSYYQPGNPTPRPFPPDKRVKLQPGYRIVFGANGAIAEIVE
jgi:serine/threonine protein kinase